MGARGASAQRRFLLTEFTSVIAPRDDNSLGESALCRETVSPSSSFRHRRWRQRCEPPLRLCFTRVMDTQVAHSAEAGDVRVIAIDEFTRSCQYKQAQFLAAGLRGAPTHHASRAKAPLQPSPGPVCSRAAGGGRRARGSLMAEAADHLHLRSPPVCVPDEACNRRRHLSVVYHARQDAKSCKREEP